MNCFSVAFDDLYRRHLCRHGHFGINVLHLFAVVGIDLAVFGLAGGLIHRLTGANPLPLLCVLVVPWFLIVVRNIPASITIVTATVVLSMLTVTKLLLPVIPWPVWLLLIPAMHRLQLWSHTVYPMERDMSQFAKEYKKGLRLFFLLLIYELPILLNYFVAGRSDWIMSRNQPE